MLAGLRRNEDHRAPIVPEPQVWHSSELAFAVKLNGFGLELLEKIDRVVLVYEACVFVWWTNCCPFSSRSPRELTLAIVSRKTANLRGIIGSIISYSLGKLDAVEEIHLHMKQSEQLVMWARQCS